MQRRDYLILFVLALLVRGGVAWLQHSPGYMDAEYYFIGGQSLARGEGFSEQVLWNYLDDPAGLPHPSHGYWMPLASVFAALGMWMAGNTGFAAAQWVFVLMGSAFPPLTAALGFALTRSRFSGWISGGLAVLPGFYLPFLTTTETFGIYAVLGALFFLALPGRFPHGATHPTENPGRVSRILVSNALRPLALGGIAGLMHLTRTEGLLWLGFAWLGALALPRPEGHGVLHSLRRVLWVLAGYALVMLPWFWRNGQVFGAPLAPGGSRALWLTDYNELFIYPASTLTFERWWASGLPAILDARLWALGQNLQRALAEQGMIFLAPLILLGLWVRRRDFRVQMAALLWLANFALMTLVFPYQGARGGFFHAGAALLPLLWAIAPLGLEAALERLARHRNWNLPEARVVFSAAMLVFAAALTAFVSGTKLIGQGGGPSAWERNRSRYQVLEATLAAFAPESGRCVGGEGRMTLPGDAPEIVMVINPPGYFASTGRRAIAIPDGDPATGLAVARRYGAHYLLLEKSHPEGLDALYAHPQSPPPGLEYLTTAEQTHFFRIRLPETP